MIVGSAPRMDPGVFGSKYNRLIYFHEWHLSSCV